MLVSRFVSLYVCVFASQLYVLVVFIVCPGDMDIISSVKMLHMSLENVLQSFICIALKAIDGEMMKKLKTFYIMTAATCFFLALFY